jgi:hypothetical protein
MRQGTARETVVKKPHRYRFYQTKKPRTQRQNLSNGNKFIGSMKTLENTQDNAGLSVFSRRSDVSGASIVGASVLT